MAKKNEIVDGIIEKVKFPNKGFMYIEENVPVCVPDTFPGQKVSVRLQKKRKGEWLGKAVAWHEQPEHFIQPKCEYFGTCGGCAMQQVPYESQLEHKHGLVMDLLKGAGVTDFEDMGILASPMEWAYRNKMEFSFGDACKDGPMCLGMHRKNSTFDIITVDGCQIVHEDFSMILRFVLRYVQSMGLPFYKKKIHEGYLRYLIVRRSETTGELLINIVTTTQREFDFTQLANYFSRNGYKRQDCRYPSYNI